MKKTLKNPTSFFDLDTPSHLKGGSNSNKRNSKLKTKPKNKDTSYYEEHLLSYYGQKNLDKSK